MGGTWRNLVIVLDRQWDQSYLPTLVTLLVGVVCHQRCSRPGEWRKVQVGHHLQRFCERRSVEPQTLFLIQLQGPIEACEAHKVCSNQLPQSTGIASCSTSMSMYTYQENCSAKSG